MELDLSLADRRASDEPLPAEFTEMQRRARAKRRAAGTAPTDLFLDGPRASRIPMTNIKGDRPVSMDGEQ